MTVTRTTAGAAGIAAAMLAAGLACATATAATAATAARAEAAARSGAQAPAKCFNVGRLVRGFVTLKDRSDAGVEALVLGQLLDKSKRAEVARLFNAAKAATGGDQGKMVRILVPQMTAICPELKPLARLVTMVR